MNPSKGRSQRSGHPGLLMAALAAILMVGTARASSASDAERQAMLDTGVDAYVYGYPLVMMEVTRRVMTNVATADGVRAPLGQLAHARTLPTAASQDGSAPNVDTLYSGAWLDLSKEPFILTLPERRGRYFLMPMLDGWTNVVAAPGTRTIGTSAQRYAIVGPGWKGRLPQGLTGAYSSPTNMVWIDGRTYSAGTPADNAAVRLIQDKSSLVPLSAYGKRYAPPPGAVDPKIDMKTPAREQVERMDVATYFKLLAELMTQSPPAAADAPMVARMATLGIVPGKDFDLGKLTPGVAWAMRGVPKAGLAKIRAHEKSARTTVNGWSYSMRTGVYGADYLQRAFIAYQGLGADLARDMVAPTTQVDADGKPLTGAHRYVIHFPRGQTPPARGHWSLTMYNADRSLVVNPQSRYAVGSRSPFELNEDGSLDLYLQKDSPGSAWESNWLPAPAGSFALMLRLYSPDRPIFDGAWKPPPVKRVK